MNEKDIWGNTVVLWATREGHVAIIKLLSNYGAVINENDGEGKTGLSMAKKLLTDIDKKIDKLSLQQGDEMEVVLELPLSSTNKNQDEISSLVEQDNNYFADKESESAGLLGVIAEA